MSAKLLQSCLTLRNPLDCSPPGASVHGIPEARILEWAAVPSSWGSSQPRNRTGVFYVSCIWRTGSLVPLGKPSTASNSSRHMTSVNHRYFQKCNCYMCSEDQDTVLKGNSLTYGWEVFIPIKSQKDFRNNG